MVFVIATLVLLGVWTGNVFGGFAWNSSMKQFNFHSLFMISGGHYQRRWWVFAIATLVLLGVWTGNVLWFCLGWLHEIVLFPSTVRSIVCMVIINGGGICYCYTGFNWEFGRAMYLVVLLGIAQWNSFHPLFMIVGMVIINGDGEYLLLLHWFY